MTSLETARMKPTGGYARPGTFTLCCVIDRHPRFYVELVLWAICAQAWLPSGKFRILVYFVGTPPPDLRDWLRARGVEMRVVEAVVEGSPHCNKIAPFLDAHETDVVAVTDADLFFVDDPSCLFATPRFRAPPNNSCNPPPHVFKAILAASGMGRGYRPGMALLRGGHGIRETHINNICGSFIAAPLERCETLARLWIKWARWLVENRSLMERWAVHVDQIGFALAMEEIGEDVELLPPQVNAILHIFDEIATVYAFHLSTGHIPKFPDRFDADGTLRPDGLAEGVANAMGRLNDCIGEAVEVISSLPSTEDHVDKFMNPQWRR